MAVAREIVLTVRDTVDASVASPANANGDAIVVALVVSFTVRDSVRYYDQSDDVVPSESNSPPRIAFLRRHKTSPLIRVSVPIHRARGEAG